MQTLLPFALFAFVASITPGPTNILILGYSARYGMRATLPLVFCACLAAAAIVLLVGLGLGEALLRYPLAQRLMNALGVLWLSWLAWQLWRAAATPIADTPGQRDLNPLGAALLQMVNPKVWMMAIAVISVFANADDRILHVLQLSAVFLLIALLCMSAWAMLGVGSARLLHSPGRLRLFNRGLALLLLVSTWFAALQ